MRERCRKFYAAHEESLVMKRRILLVDDEVAVLLTMKAVLEISGFEVDTAASAKDAKLKLKKNPYAMIITDMRMESDEAGHEVIQAARDAEYHPAVALLTAFHVAEEDWQEFDTDKVEVLLKPMHTKVLLQQIEILLTTHEQKKAATTKAPTSTKKSVATKQSTAKKVVAKKAPAKKAVKKAAPVKAVKSPTKKAAKKTVATKATKTSVKKAAKKIAKKATRR
jgi:DNA-binding response OmpR family regulator